MSNVDFVERPGSVKFVTVMMYVAAASYAVGIYINLLLLMRSDQGQLFFDSPVSDWYWIIGALLDFILVVAFIWIARMAWRGDYSAGVLITLLLRSTSCSACSGLGRGMAGSPWPCRSRCWRRTCRTQRSSGTDSRCHVLLAEGWPGLIPSRARARFRRGG